MAKRMRKAVAAEEVAQYTLLDTGMSVDTEKGRAKEKAREETKARVKATVVVMI